MIKIRCLGASSSLDQILIQTLVVLGTKELLSCPHHQSSDVAVQNP
jgi:hypothetical protein